MGLAMDPARILLAAVIAIAPGPPALAHSWYPKECCSDRDCMPADGIASDARGHRIVLVGARRIWIPNGLAARPSPDGRVHICFRVVAGELDNSTFTVPICLFVPAQS
jgi:hypothetical protein